ncbi:MAG: hypothetical protein WCC17_11985 [Candidatus Nitrosopolaris sp.]
MSLKKRTRWSLIAAGLILVISGIIFTLQSKFIVGPTSSFMYGNPGWTVNGSVVIGIGIVVLVSGFLLWRIYSK